MACGDRTTFGAAHNGDSAGRGSLSKTSNTAPANQPVDSHRLACLLKPSARVRALSSTVRPRPTFPKIAPSFISENFSASKNPDVSSVPGRTSSTRSHCGSISANSRPVNTPSHSAAGDCWRRYTSTRLPSARNTVQSWLPIAPWPKRPTVIAPRGFSSRQWSQHSVCPQWRLRWYSLSFGSRRVRARIMPSRCSTTTGAFTLAELVSTTRER